MKLYLKTAMNRIPLYVREYGPNVEALLAEISRQIPTKLSRGFTFTVNKTYVSLIAREDMKESLKTVTGDFVIGTFHGEQGVAIDLIITIHK